MRGENERLRPARKPNGQIAGGGGGAFSEMNAKIARNRAYGTREWINEQIASGDMAPGQLSSAQSGTSIFDPVLCELIYRWFCPENGSILDPFAGGSVRGIVASKLGRPYLGIELRSEQVAANEQQADLICSSSDPRPRWICGDSMEIVPSLSSRFDLLFTCPPYGDLEVYSSDPRDISGLGRGAFEEKLKTILSLSQNCITPDRFSCVVISDYRDRRGFYTNLPGQLVSQFEQAGAGLYNEIILITAAGSLPIRAGKQFSTTRKLGRTHQEALIFCNGDPRKATAACGTIEIADTPWDEAGL